MLVPLGYVELYLPSAHPSIMTINYHLMHPHSPATRPLEYPLTPTHRPHPTNEPTSTYLSLCVWEAPREHEQSTVLDLLQQEVQEEICPDGEGEGGQ